MTEGTIEVASNIARAADEITATFVTTRNHLMKFTLDFAYIPNFRSPSMWNNQIGFHTKTANNSKVIGYSLANISGSILDVYDKLELTLLWSSFFVTP